MARTEERYMRKQFGAPYEDYMHRVPAFFPPRHQWMAFFTAPVADETRGRSLN